MSTYSRRLLSGSTDGECIPVVATATAGTLIHTAVTGTSAFDEVYCWVNNITGAAVTLTVEWGAAGNGNHICDAVSIPANSPPYPILTGQNLQNGLTVKMFASTASALNISGYVNRIS